MKTTLFAKNIFSYNIFACYGMTTLRKAGFTLIELSIVLVIIGLLVGGVLAGRDLIKSAEVRSQVSQMEKLNIAVNTFKLKYGGMAGDLPYEKAQAFGLFAINGIGNDDSLLLGFEDPSYVTLEGEPVMFFRQLSDAKLIDRNYGHAIDINGYPSDVDDSLPPAKIGKGAVIYANSPYDGKNYFLLTKTKTWNFGNYGGFSSNPLTAQESSSIDAKIDDGKPASGSVVAIDAANNLTMDPPTWTTTSAVSDCVVSSAYATNPGTSQACSLRFQFK